MVNAYCVEFFADQSVLRIEKNLELQPNSCASLCFLFKGSGSSNIVCRTVEIRGHFGVA